MRLILPAIAAAALAASPAFASTYIVNAASNSSTGGTGLSSITLVAGQTYHVSANVNDLWSAGSLPRWSDANGLIGDRYANPSDDSGQAPGTLIGANFGTWTQNGHSAAFGQLVGLVGSDYLNLGTNVTFVAPSSGTLNLYYWDQNNSDNSGSITFNIAAAGVPEPAVWGMMILGFGVVGGAMRSRRRTVRLAA